MDIAYQQYSQLPHHNGKIKIAGLIFSVAPREISLKGK